MTNKEAIEILEAFRFTDDALRKTFYKVDKALDLAIKALEEYDALHLLVEWAEECDFGYDNFPEEYEKYKDEIEGMKYIEGMIHIAKRTLEEAENDTIIL